MEEIDMKGGQDGHGDSNWKGVWWLHDNSLDFCCANRVIEVWIWRHRYVDRYRVNGAVIGSTALGLLTLDSWWQVWGGTSGDMRLHDLS